MPDYLLDQDHREDGSEASRLRVQESALDPVTFGHLEALGVAPGWHCLEAGAGGGSVAVWLARRVGPTGRVVAADRETALLEQAELPRVFPHLEVRRVDLAEAEPEPAAYDLVHARDLLIHLPTREAVLARLAAAVKPGGWILVEEPDLVTEGPDPTAPEPLRRRYGKVLAAIHGFLAAQGLDLCFGARLFGLLRSLGFEEVHAEGRVRSYAGGGAETSPHMLAFAQLRGPVTAGGAVTAEEYDAFLALADDPAFAWREGLTVSARGRRPA
jgi:SAM-dependent methyltransferase